MEVVKPFRRQFTDERTDHWLHKRSIKRMIDLGHSRNSRKAALVRGIVAPERSDVIERSRFTAHQPIAAHKLWICDFSGPRFKDRFVQARRERINQVDVAGQFAM